MKAKNTICLWFDKDAQEAARFYAATFPDSEVTAVRKAPGDYPGGKEGDVLTVEFTVLGVPCLGINGGPEFKHSEAFSFQIATDNQEETDRYWNAIVGNGGKESQCGWCKDRWGLSWQITPRALTEALAAGGGEAKRAFDGNDADEEDRRRHHRGSAAGLTWETLHVRSSGNSMEAEDIHEAFSKAAALARAPRNDGIVAKPRPGPIADARHYSRSVASGAGIARVDRDHAGGVVLGLRAELSGRRHRVRVWMAAQIRRDADPGDYLRRRDDDRGKRRIPSPRPNAVDARVRTFGAFESRLPPLATGTSMPADDFGFPSGHVATTAAWALGLAWSRRKPWQLGAAATWIALMALSRMYLGRHFPADVIGGLVVGVAGLAIARLALPPACRGHQYAHGRRQDGTGRVAHRPWSHSPRFSAPDSALMMPAASVASWARPSCSCARGRSTIPSRYRRGWPAWRWRSSFLVWRSGRARGRSRRAQVSPS